MLEKTSRDLILWFFLTLLIISFFLFGKLIWPFISSLVLASVITGIFNPLYYLIQNKFKPSIASFLTCIIIFFILFVPILFISSLLIKEAYEVYLWGIKNNPLELFKNLIINNNILPNINYVLSKIGFEITTEDLIKPISEFGQQVGIVLFEQARYMASNTVNIIFKFFIMLIVIFYLFIDSKRLVWFIIDLSPLPNNQDNLLIQKFRDMAGAVLIGNGIGGLIQGTIGGILFAIFDFRAPILWGTIMCFLAFLPIVGIGIVLIPSAIYLLLNGQIGSGIFFFVFYIILSGGIEYFFKPRFVGQRIQMHTMIVFLSIMGGMNLFGILGIIYGPLIATFFLTLTDIYHSNYQKTVETENNIVNQ